MQALPRRLQFKTVGFPHSDISGSKATNRLPEAYRRLVASFLAVLGQGIHRVLLCLSYGDLHSTFIFCTPSHRNYSLYEGFLLFAYSPRSTTFQNVLFVTREYSRATNRNAHNEVSPLSCATGFDVKNRCPHPKRKPPQGAVFVRLYNARALRPIRFSLVGFFGS